jgi:O-antigen/teichoic acid export membrane protein
MQSRTIVARNALFMLVSQVATTALSFATVPLIARALGSGDYGTWWLAGAVAGVAALFIDWGLDGYVVLAVARSQERAPELLATSALFRLGMGLFVAIPLEGALRLLGYDANTRMVVFLLYIGSLVSSIAASAVAVVRGLERMGGPALARIGTEVMHTGLVFSALALGAGLKSFAAIEIVGAFVGLTLSARAVLRVRVRPTGANLGTAKELLRGGAPFLLWTSILVLQPGLESVLLSKLALHEAVGWYGAAIRLVGFLLFPAGVLQTVFMPTMARLHASNFDEYRETALDSLRVALLLGAPIAVGTYVFAGPGVSLIFGPTFGPAAGNLRMLSVYVLVVFLNISLSTIVVSAGRTMTWSIMKGFMVAFGAGASFLAIPYFQQKYGNGGMGAALITVIAEVGMLLLGLLLVPKGLLGRRLVLDLLRAAVASAAMAAAAHFLARTPLGVAMAAALIAYAVVLVLVGGIGARDLLLVRNTVGGVLNKSRGTRE